MVSSYSRYDVPVAFLDSLCGASSGFCKIVIALVS